MFNQLVHYLSYKYIYIYLSFAKVILNIYEYDWCNKKICEIKA